MEQNRTILLVEDEALIAMEQKKQLESAGYRVVTAMSGEKAIHIISDKQYLIHLILMDIDLGRGMDGTETAKRILKDIEIPVVFLSSHTESEVVQKTEEITSYGYVVKNSGLRVLDASIKMAFTLFGVITARKQAEEALRESQQKLARTIEFLPDATFVVNRAGVVTAWNKAMKEMTGVKAEDILEKGDYEYALPFYGTRRKILIDLVFEMDNDIEGKYDFVKREDDCLFAEVKTQIEGERRFFWGKAVPLYDTKGEIVAAIESIRDITEQKEAEESMRKKQRALSTLNEVITIGNRAEDLTSLFASVLQNTLRLMDYDGGGIYIRNSDGATARIVYSINLPQEFLEHVRSVKINEEPYRTLFKDGKAIVTDHFDEFSPDRAKESGFLSLMSVPLFSKNEIIGALNVISKKRSSTPKEEGETLLAIGRELGTLVERIGAEEELRASESKYRLLVDYSSDLIWNLDAQGILTFVSPSWERMTGHPASSIVGQSFESFVHPEDINKCKEQVVSLKTSREQSPGIEYRVLHGDGKWHVHLTTATPVLDAKGNFQSIVGVSQDVTERKITEDKIQKLLKEKEIILKEVHHRVKNNMNTILSLIALRADAKENAESKNLLLDIAGCVKSMKVLYDKLYNTETRDIVSANDYLATLIDEIVGIFPHGSNVKIIKEMEEIDLNAKRLSPLGIIVNELITNAMKYAFQDREDGIIRVNLRRDSGDIVLGFEDNGPGIPDLAERKEVPGFGLQLINMLVLQLSGSIEIDASKGTQFRIRFKE